MAGKRQTNRPWGHRRAEAQPVPRTDGEAGETLIEVLLSVMLTGLMVVAVLGGLLAAVNASAVQRRSAMSEVVVNNFAEALADAPYVACADTADYQPDPDPELDKMPNFESADGYTVKVDTVLGWKKGTAGPAEFLGMDEICPGDGTDTELQEISYTVHSDNGDQDRSHSVLKRYIGTNYDLDQALPGGGSRCTITADRDTFVDQNAPDTAQGDKPTMDLVGTGLERESLIHFDLSPDTGTCLEDDEDPQSLTEVPADMKVVSATLRLYTWQVSGAPDCGANECDHALNRATEDWTEADTTWSSKPDLSGDRTATFAHGTGTGDHSPRTQTVTSDRLNAEVKLFYAAPGLNHGWSIRQDCGSSGDDCTSPSPGFRMRTSEWDDVSQRPTLTVVFAPDDVPGRHLRSAAYDTCLSTEATEGGTGSVFEDQHLEFADGAAIRTTICVGRTNQLWVHPTTGDAAGQFRPRTSKSCLETGNTDAPGTNLLLWECWNNESYQRWNRDGLTIRYGENKEASDMCMTATGPGYNDPVELQECDGRDEQKWLFEAPASHIPKPDVRLTSLDTEGQPTSECADLDVVESGAPQGQGVPIYAQTFPCLGDTQVGQTWNHLSDGRLVSRLNPMHCLSYGEAGGNDIVMARICGQGDEQVWVVEGSQIRNLYKQTCVTSIGGRQWLTLEDCGSGPDPVPAGQAWRLDSPTEPALADIVQIRNTEYGDCMDVQLPAVNPRVMSTLACGEAGRDGQEFIRLSNTNEFALRADPSFCLTAEGTIRVWTCAQIGNENTDTARKQRWPVNELGQLEQGTTNDCAQGNNTGQNITRETCLPAGDDDLPTQQWILEEKGATTSSLRQMRNKATNSCVDMPAYGNATSWPCTGPDRPIQGLLLGKVGDEYEIRLATNPSMCIDVQDGGGNNAPVMAIDCNRGDYQRWTMSADGQLKTKSPQGLCLQGGLDNAPLFMNQCLPIDDQSWTFEDPLDTRELRQIRNVASQVCLDRVGTPEEGNVVVGFPCGPEAQPGQPKARPNQVFIQLNNGAYASAASTDKLCIDAGYGHGDPLVFWDCKNPAGSQQWVNNTEGRFQQVASGLCAAFEPAADRARVRNCGNATDQPNQQWSVEEVGTAGVSAAIQFRRANGAEPDDPRNNGCLDVTGITLDATGTTRPAFLDNDPVGIMPCLGPNRINQSFQLMSDGHIRSSTTPNECLDAASTATAQHEVVLYGCKDPQDPNQDDQYWNIDESGRLVNVTAGGAERRCLQGGLDGMPATMEPCSTSEDQKWVKEELGATLRSEAVGQLSLAQGNRCMDTNQPIAQRPFAVFENVCSTGSLQQRFVRLNSGQYRPAAYLNRCLDATGGGTPLTAECDLPTDDGAGDHQRWILGTITGWFSANSSTLCAEAPGGTGQAIQQRACNGDDDANPTNPAQQWSFKPEPTDPGGL